MHHYKQVYTKRAFRLIIIIIKCIACPHSYIIKKHNTTYVDQAITKQKSFVTLLLVF